MNPEEEPVDLDALPPTGEEARPEVVSEESVPASEEALGEPPRDVAAEPQSADAAESATADAPESATADAPEAVPETNPEADPDADPAEDPTLVAIERALPDLTEDSALEAALEALLLVVDSPASEESLADAVDQPEERVTATLRAMSERLTERGSGIDLRRVGEGWRFFTRDTYAPFVEKLLLDGQRSKLTRAALETLAVIAYRQPVTRSRVAAVRGVNVDGVIRTLLARGLIEEAGTDPETGGILYLTTELFLERLGLSSLNDLPPIAPLLPEVDAIDDI